MSPVTTEDTNNGMEEQVVVSKNYINNKLLLQQGIIEVNTMDSAGLQMNLEDNTRIHEINIPRIFLTQNLNPFEWSQVLSNCMGNTALHYAISQANWPIVYTLMNNSTKTDVNKFNRAGYTPLMMAAMWISKINNVGHSSGGYTDEVNSLNGLCKSCEPSKTENSTILGNMNTNYQPLPITKEDTATLDMVVSRANLKLISQNDFKRTVLILAAIYGCETIVSSVLTKRKSLINQSDAGGSTAIMCAAEHNHLNVVTVLLGQSKINLQLKDINGRTALEIAIAKQNYLIALLIYAKIQVQRLNTSYYRNIHREIKFYARIPTNDYQTLSSRVHLLFGFCEIQVRSPKCSKLKKFFRRTQFTFFQLYMNGSDTVKRD
ncbi:unnamed protein product [Trichobilharzia regenti]|nr:unnamed protein product [Trichobilharzia regenti]